MPRNRAKGLKMDCGIISLGLVVARQRNEDGLGCSKCPRHRVPGRGVAILCLAQVRRRRRNE
jgi:hypothetical protein